MCEYKHNIIVFFSVSPFQNVYVFRFFFFFSFVYGDMLIVIHIHTHVLDNETHDQLREPEKKTAKQKQKYWKVFRSFDYCVCLHAPLKWRNAQAREQATMYATVAAAVDFIVQCLGKKLFQCFRYASNVIKYLPWPFQLKRKTTKPIETNKMQKKKHGTFPFLIQFLCLLFYFFSIDNNNYIQCDLKSLWNREEEKKKEKNNLK